MSNLEKDYTDVLAVCESSFSEDKNYETLEKALNDFNDMVAKGITTPRGYTLQTVNENELSFNLSNL